MTELVEITFIIEAKTELAVMDENEFWVAKSQMHGLPDGQEFNIGEDITVSIPRWLAAKGGYCEPPPKRYYSKRKNYNDNDDYDNDFREYDHHGYDWD